MKDVSCSSEGFLFLFLDGSNSWREMGMERIVEDVGKLRGENS